MIGSAELERMGRDTQRRLKADIDATIPDVSDWDYPENTQMVLEALYKLANIVKHKQLEARANVESLENVLVEQKSDLTRKVNEKKAKIYQDQQKLQELLTQISSNELEMTVERKQFYLKVKPKFSQLDKATRRYKIIKGTKAE